jgi:CPA2 family monovalent cation:H+ antiporter-2
MLFALTVLGGATLTAWYAQLTPALGALAAGIILNGNRLSRQFDALILPYRETFTAVFFVSLGSLMRLETLVDGPLVVLGGLTLIVLLKTAAAAGALRLVGLGWRSALGMGLGLAQLGELAFVLLSEASGRGLISTAVYHRMLFIAVGSLILTPQLLKTGLRWADTGAKPPSPPGPSPDRSAAAALEAMVVGLGPMGTAVASQLELQGHDVSLVDLSPVNLHRFAQQGFRTVAGDAGDAEILRHARVEHCQLAVVTVPDDRTAARVVPLVRRLNPRARILVRCRFQGSLATLRRAGADAVVSEEAEAAGALLRLLQ